MGKVTFTVQLEKGVHKDLSTNAKKIGIKNTDYVRNIIREELETKAVLNRLTRG